MAFKNLSRKLKNESFYQRIGEANVDRLHQENELIRRKIEDKQGRSPYNNVIKVGRYINDDKPREIHNKYTVQQKDPNMVMKSDKEKSEEHESSEDILNKLSEILKQNNNEGMVENMSKVSEILRKNNPQKAVGEIVSEVDRTEKILNASNNQNMVDSIVNSHDDDDEER